MALAGVPLVLLALASGCATAEDTEGFSGPQLPSLDRFGIHIHPTTSDAGDVEELFEVATLARMQAPFEAQALVGDFIEASPPDSRWLIVLDQRPALDLVERFADDPRVVAYELENEPEFFLGWTSTQYVSWLRTVAPRVRARLGSHQRLASAATFPVWVNFPGTYEWNTDLVASGALELVDIYSLHVYGELDLVTESRLVFLADVVNAARRYVDEVWVTEYGHADDGLEVAYAKDMPYAIANEGVTIDRWIWYSWRDEELGFSLEHSDGTISPLLTELRMRVRPR